MNSLRNKLKLLRQREGLSQKALADLTGISQGAIGDIESGRKKSLNGESLQKLCSHPRLNQYTLWLLTDDPSKISEPPANYLKADGAKLFRSLDKGSKAQAIAYMQLLKAQTTPD
jgi:transcriptional regulator with XRE-family HTH domain